MLDQTIRQRAEWKAATATADHLRATTKARWPHDAPKFLDLDQWLKVNLARAAKLGLTEGSGRKVLDLGSGTGQFLFVCRMLGHAAVGVDLPVDALESPEREIFTEMPRAFQVNVVRSAISAFHPLQVEGKFDLICSFMVCFNNLKREDEWTVPQWEFFVRDMLSRLNPGGKLALRLNHNEEKFGPRGYFDPETQAFFTSVGTESDGKIVIPA
jgi:SAM-dependent methyltransferase